MTSGNWNWMLLDLGVNNTHPYNPIFHRTISPLHVPKLSSLTQSSSHAFTFFLPLFVCQPSFLWSSSSLCVCLYLSFPTFSSKSIFIKLSLTAQCKNSPHLLFFLFLCFPLSRENWKQNESRSRNPTRKMKSKKSLSFHFACVADTFLPSACWLSFSFSFWVFYCLTHWFPNAFQNDKNSTPTLTITFCLWNTI